MEIKWSVVIIVSQFVFFGKEKLSSEERESIVVDTNIWLNQQRSELSRPMRETHGPTHRTGAALLPLEYILILHDFKI